MSLRKYKKIEDNRGFFIDDRDSQIFETEFQKSLYGEGENDVISFTLYDVNENLLPQQGYGNTRYIHSSDFSEYFKKIKGTENQTNNQPFEYELNVDKLIKEGGYTTGIFNVEILLINNRVGSNHERDRVWIHEISPSRTEIRVLPLKVKNQKLQELINESYQSLIDNKTFLDDIREVLDLFIDSIHIENIEELLIKKYGGKFVRRMRTQFFKDGGFNLTMINIVEDFKNSVRYVVENKNSSIGDVNFGKPLEVRPPVSLDIKKKKKKKLRESISYHLPVVSEREDVNKEYRERQIDIETQNLIKRVEERSSVDVNPTIERTTIEQTDGRYVRRRTLIDDDEQDVVIDIEEVPEDIIPKTPAPEPILQPDPRVPLDTTEREVIDGERNTEDIR